MKLPFIKEEKVKTPKFVYALISFTPDATDLCVGGSENMKILVYSHNDLIEAYDFNRKRIEQLRDRGIPVLFEDKGPIPRQCRKKEPEIYFTFGKLRFM